MSPDNEVNQVPAGGVLITVAPTGAEHDKARVTALPATTEELVDTAVRCERAGAAIIHVHVRDAAYQPTLDIALLRERVAAIRENTDLIVQLSTGGGVHDPLDARLAVLEAEPDSCSLSCGTLNFGDDVFLNPWGFMVDLFEAAREHRVVPEFEIFDIGQLHSLGRLIDQCGLPFGGSVHIDFVMGVPGGMPGDPHLLLSAVSMMPEAVTSWSATGLGRAHLPIMATAMAAGGHVRVGMEDNLFVARGRQAAHNDEFVTRAAELAGLMQRPVLTPGQARTLLGIRSAAVATA